MTSMELQMLWFGLRAALLQGTPPLYQQLLAATMVFVVLRLWIWWRNRRVRRILLDPRIFTGLWLASMVLLSLGLLDHLRAFYNNYYVSRALYVLKSLII